MHAHALFLGIAISFAGACTLGIALLRLALGQEWLLLALAGAALIALGRAVRWRTGRARDAPGTPGAIAP